MRGMKKLGRVFTMTLAISMAIAVGTSNREAEAKTHLAQGRAFHVRVPAGVGKPASSPKLPLVILIHGLMADSTMQDAYFQLGSIVDTKRFIYAYVDGTRNAPGIQFWNATEVCCQAGPAVGGGPPIDDVGFLNSVIDTMVASYPIDEKRVFLVGHSNGAFMAQRMACDNPRIAGIVSVAGALSADASKCNAKHKVAMLEIHGTNDEIVPYGGGTPALTQLTRITLPVIQVTSAKVTAERWAARNGCGQKRDGGKFDLESSIAGQETNVDRYDCPTTAGVELWTINGAPHVPKFFIRDAPGFPALPGNDPSFPERVYDWLNAHPKP